MPHPAHDPLFDRVALPCGAALKNRLIKGAMSDSLGDGAGCSTAAQAALYRLWGAGGAALALIGEVQFDPEALEAPGNLLLGPGADLDRLHALTAAARDAEMHLWAQIGHAGALAYQPLGRRAGPSRLDLDGLSCEELSVAEIEALPSRYADAAQKAQAAGFSGVQVHAAHGFLLSQFLSPLFNRRGDAWGGAAANRARVLIEVVEAVRAAVGAAFPVALKINGSDMMAGGLSPDDARETLRLLAGRGIDLVDISAGTYFPGAASASDKDGGKGWMRDLAAEAKRALDAPVMINAGVRTARQALDDVARGDIELIAMARPLIVHPDLPNRWRDGALDVQLPRLSPTLEGAVTAWYTMQLSSLAATGALRRGLTADDALAEVTDRDRGREAAWRGRAQAFAGA